LSLNRSANADGESIMPDCRHRQKDMLEYKERVDLSRLDSLSKLAQLSQAENMGY